jgi:hypothetical protein
MRTSDRASGYGVVVVGIDNGAATLGSSALQDLYAELVRSTVLSRLGSVAVSFTPWSDMHDTNACRAC